MKSPQTKIRLLQEKYQENVDTMFKTLLRDETLSDITIHCRDGFLRAHKVILASCSPYFKKVFEDRPEPHVVFMVHGVSIKQMKNLVELMYRGSTDVSTDLMTKLYEVAEDFGIKGIIDENDRSSTSNPGRDTRFRGQKRVAVDFEQDSSLKSPSSKSPKSSTERSMSVCSEKSFKKSTENLFTSSSTINSSISSVTAAETSTSLMTLVKQEPPSPSLSAVSSSPGHLSAEARRRHNWAMKQRKYKCGTCPASFKRASHLSRHQLVHTGERPYPCGQCDKAFSRHDKLKHHIRKTHESAQYDDVQESYDNLYTVGRVEILSPDADLSEVPTRITREDLMPRSSSLPAKIPESAPSETLRTPTFRSIIPKVPQNVPTASSVPQKKGRGRPRKYPPVPRPLIKRPRGRPRLNPIAPRPGTQLDTSTPQPERCIENYDITNMPFGDLEYLTKPLRENNDQLEDSNNSTMESNLMEPLVEIQLDQAEQQQQREKPNQLVHEAAGHFLHNIGLLENTAVANIGECTISLTSPQNS